MKLTQLFLVSFTFFSLLLLNVSHAQGTTPKYIDYLPKYRSVATNFILSKIEYTEKDMIISFRYVAEKDNDLIQFYGPENHNTWQFTTAIHPRYEAQAVSRKPEVMNVRLNDEQQKDNLAGTEEWELKASKGDIVTCEMKLEQFPRTIRSFHLKGGAVNNQGEERFAANDIQIKTIDNTMLGNSNQMEQSIQAFYGKQKHVNYPDIKNITSADEQKHFDKKLEETKTTKRDNPLQQALEPIDYMPKVLNTSDDLDCNERIILRNVYFHDNKAEFAGRVKAMKTLAVVIEYLNYQPKAKIVLHGHTDIFGNAFKNLELSKQRVETVKRAMASKGIDRSRIITVHHGGSQPLPKYKNGGAMNRRVEVEVLCSGVIGEIEVPDLKADLK